MKRRITTAAGLVLLALGAAHGQTFGDGTHVVGLDIQPGIYRAPGGDTCIWQRLSGFSGEYQDIIASGLLATKPTVEILAADKAFMAQNCGQWTLLQVASSAESPASKAAPIEVRQHVAAILLVSNLATVIKALTQHAEPEAVAKVAQWIRDETLSAIGPEDQKQVASMYLDSFEKKLFEE